MRPTIPASRWPRRTAAGVGALLALLLGVFVFSSDAYAHHSEINAEVDCEFQVTWTAEAWNGSTEAQRTNLDVDVWYRIGAGPVVPVANGAFTIGNGYQFGGSFAWPDLAAPSLTLYVQEQANWGNGASPSSARSTTIRLPGDCPTPEVAVSADCDSVDITSTKDISNIVWQRQDGTEGKEDGLSGTAFSLPNDPANPVVAVWVKSGNNKLAEGDPAPTGDWGEGVGEYHTVDAPEGCAGEPAVQVDLTCVDGDGTAVVTLENSGGYLPVTFVVTDPRDASTQQVVVPVGGSQNVVLDGLPDGQHTIGVTADGVPMDQQISVDCDRPGEPEVGAAVECVEGDGTATVTLDNVGGDLPVTFVVTNPVTAGETVEVVPVGETRTVTLPGLPDGEHTVAVTADGVPMDQAITVDCDRPGVPSVEVDVSCVDFDGVVEVTLGNTGGDLPVTFVVTDPQTAVETVEVVPVGETRTVTFSGLPDGDHTVAVSGDGTPLDQQVSFDCDRPGIPEVSAAVECTETGGLVTVTLANASPAGTAEPITFVVTDPRDDTTTEVLVEAGGSATVELAGVPDGTSSVPVSADGEDLDPIEVTVDCEQPEVGGVVQECADEGMTIGVANPGGSPTEVEVLVDGTLLEVVAIPAGGSVEVTIPMAEDETVLVEVRHGEEVLAEIELTRNCEEPPTTTTTEPSPTTTEAPTTTSAGAPTTVATVLGTTQSRSGELPVTGSDAGRLALAGGGLVAIGAGLLLLGQRRRL